MDISHPGIPGADNRWFPSQGQARKAALVVATHRGPGYRIVHDARPARGQSHYHVVDSQGRRVSGHLFYGQRPPRKVYRGRPWRESEAPVPGLPDVEAKITRLLQIPISSKNEKGFLWRKRELAALFRSLTPDQAGALLNRLGFYRRDDALSCLFHYRLATATREFLLIILEFRIIRDLQ